MRGEPDSSCWKVDDAGGSEGSWLGERPALGMVSDGGGGSWDVLGVGGFLGRLVLDLALAGWRCLTGPAG